MRHVRMLGTYLLTLIALTAIGATVAQADKIEVGKCYEVPTRWGGKYTDANCTNKAEKKSGRYEWAQLAPGEQEPLPMASEDTISFETKAGRIECPDLGPTSVLYLLNRPTTGETQATPYWEFQGCKEPGGQGCQSAFSIEQDEISNEYEWFGWPSVGWTYKLGLISDAEPSNPIVGLQYTVKNRGELVFEPIVCEGALKTIQIGAAKGKASWISAISPVNEMTHIFTQTYSASEPKPGEYLQSPASFESKKTSHLEAYRNGEWEPLAMIATFHDEVEGGKGLEIKTN